MYRYRYRGTTSKYKYNKKINQDKIWDSDQKDAATKHMFDVVHEHQTLKMR